VEARAAAGGAPEQRLAPKSNTSLEPMQPCAALVDKVIAKLPGGAFQVPCWRGAAEINGGERDRSLAGFGPKVDSAPRHLSGNVASPLSGGQNAT